MCGGAAHLQLIAAPAKVARVDVGGAQVLQTVKGREFGRDPGWGKEKLEGFPRPFNPRRQRVVCQLFEQRERGARLSVIQGQTAAGALRGNKAKRSPKGLERKVGNHAQPGEKSRRLAVETSDTQFLCQRLALKINRRVGDAIRNGNVVALQQFALPLLGSWVVDLKDTKLGKGIPIGEGIESGAQKNILFDAA